MWKHWEPLLTEEAAREDAERFTTSLARILREVIVYYMLFPSDIHFLYRHRKEQLEQLSEKDFLNAIFHAMGVMIDAFELLKFSLRKIYAYASGAEENDKEEIDSAGELVDMWGMMLWKLYMVFDPHQSTYIDFTSPVVEINIQTQEVFAKTVSLRFMHALRMYRLRRRIEKAVAFLREHRYLQERSTLFQNFQENPGLIPMLTISPSSLAFLANVSYPYITKLIREQKLHAYKQPDSRFWAIPVREAIAFAVNRDDCPGWLKRLQGY